MLIFGSNSALFPFKSISSKKKKKTMTWNMAKYEYNRCTIWHVICYMTYYMTGMCYRNHKKFVKFYEILTLIINIEPRIIYSLQTKNLISFLTKCIKNNKIKYIKGKIHTYFDIFQFLWNNFQFLAHNSFFYNGFSSLYLL